QAGPVHLDAEGAQLGHQFLITEMLRTGTQRPAGSLLAVLGIRGLLPFHDALHRHPGDHAFPLHLDHYSRPLPELTILPEEVLCKSYPLPPVPADSTGKRFPDRIVPGPTTARSVRLGSRWWATAFTAAPWRTWDSMGPSVYAVTCAGPASAPFLCCPN